MKKIRNDYQRDKDLSHCNGRSINVFTWMNREEKKVISREHTYSMYHYIVRDSRDNSLLTKLNSLSVFYVCYSLLFYVSIQGTKVCFRVGYRCLDKAVKTPHLLIVF